MEIILAYADKNVSKLVKEHIKRLPSGYFSDVREKKLFEAVVQGNDLFECLPSVGLDESEVLDVLESDKYSLFVSLDEQTQLNKLSAMLDKYRKESIVKYVQLFESRILSNSGDEKESLNTLVKQVAKLPSFQTNNNTKAAVKDFVELTEKYLTKEKKSPKVSTPFAEMNRMFKGGFQEKDVVILGARTEGGKTALATNFARHWAEQGKKILYVTTEMPERDLLIKWILQQAYINNISFNPATFFEPESEKDVQLIAELSSVIANWDVTFSTLKSDLNDIVFDMNKNKYDIVIVDHLHGIKGHEEADKMSEILLAFKQYAVDNDALLFVLGQYRKDDTYGKNRAKAPHLGMFRYSVALADYASYVLAIHEEDEQENADERELHIVKDRHTGTRGQIFPLEFIKERQIFKEKY